MTSRLRLPGSASASSDSHADSAARRPEPWASGRVNTSRRRPYTTALVTSSIGRGRIQNSAGGSPGWSRTAPLCTLGKFNCNSLRLQPTRSERSMSALAEDGISSGGATAAVIAAERMMSSST
jgi:hypothetical protein